MKAYSYLRFSTPEQSQGDSTRRQTDLAKKYAEEHSLDLDEKLTFQDLGVSALHGKNAETGALGVFLQAVREGRVEKGSYLLVESLDRISRKKARKALHILESICEEGITVVTLMDRREYTEESLDDDPTSLLMSILIFMRANEESETKSNRIKAVWENKRAKMPEQAVSARLPAWLKLDKDANTFRVIEERADVVRRVFNMAVTGCGINSIVRALNHDRIPNFGHGKMWYSSYVWLLLNSPTVVGDFIPNVIEYEDGKKAKRAQKPILGYYPAIIDRDLYQQVKALTQSKAPLRGRSAGSPVRNIFGGLAKCPLCGSTMSFIDKGKRSYHYHYMACSKARVGRGCKYRAVRYEMLEQFFVSEAHRLEIPIGVEHLDEGWEGLQQLLFALQSYHGELLEDMAKGRPKVVVDKMIKGVEAQIAEVESQVDAMRPEIASRRERLTDLNVERMLLACKETPLDRAKLNTVMRQLLKGVVIDYQSGELCFEWKHGGESSLKFAWGEEDTQVAIN
ncbi:MAG: recombinase family protein [Syntrophobacteraceae bacterium]